MWQTIKDWCWWTFVIRRNEFHPKLDELDCELFWAGKISLKEILMRRERKRNRAHRLDMRWGGE